MFWTKDVNLLFVPVLIPTEYMSIDEKLNVLTRLVIFASISIALILQDMRVILLMIILVIMIAMLYNFHYDEINATDTFMAEKNLKIVDNAICVRPSKENPFMNPNMTDISTENIGACPVYNKSVENTINKLYDESMYRNVDDIYDTTTGKRQFYTVPANTIPNDQTTFANWLYNRGKSCKERNGIQCFKNLYKDLRI